MRKPTATDTMVEVWESKHNVFEETGHLSGAAYFRYLRQEAVVHFPNIPTPRDRARSLPHGVGSREAPHVRVADPGVCCEVGRTELTSGSICGTDNG